MGKVRGRKDFFSFKQGGLTLDDTMYLQLLNLYTGSVVTFILGNVALVM